MQSGMPATISSWMWAVWAKTYGQNAKSAAAVARGAAVAGESAGEQPREDDRRREGEQHDELCAAKGLRGGQPDRHGDRARADVGLGEGERVTVRREDVGVEQLAGIRSSSACATQATFQTREPPIAGVLRAAEMPEAGDERPRHDDRRGRAAAPTSTARSGCSPPA